MNSVKTLNNFYKTCLWYITVKLASCAKMSFIIGSHCAFFSATSIMMPLSGAFTGAIGSCIIFLSTTLGHSFITGDYTLVSLAYHIPGLCAALYWAMPIASIRLLIPLACMILFVIHPIGGQVAIYSLYWLIPIVLYANTKKSLWLTALGSTFIAHAVGSVIWLYTVPMPADNWLCLLPIVAVERLMFALGMVVVYKSIEYAKHIRALRYTIAPLQECP